MTINYLVGDTKINSQQFNGNANNNLSKNDVNLISAQLHKYVDSNCFTFTYINGTLDKSDINDPNINSWKYGNNVIEIRADRPLGYFNDDGQWVDLNSNMKLTDVFPTTHLAQGRDAAIKKGAYWFVQESDHRKNFGDDKCPFDATVLGAFTPNSWGAFNWKYYVNDPDSLSSDGPVTRVLTSVKKSDK